MANKGKKKGVCIFPEAQQLLHQTSIHSTSVQVKKPKSLLYLDPKIVNFPSCNLMSGQSVWIS
jgi:hypothetical protein